MLKRKSPVRIQDDHLNHRINRVLLLTTDESRRRKRYYESRLGQALVVDLRREREKMYEEEKVPISTTSTTRAVLGLSLGVGTRCVSFLSVSVGGGPDT